MSVLPCMLIAAFLVAGFFTVGHIGVHARRRERAARAQMLATLATVDVGTGSSARMEMTAASPLSNDRPSELALADAPRHADGERDTWRWQRREQQQQQQLQQSALSQQQPPRPGLAGVGATATGAARATRRWRKRGAADLERALDSAADDALSS